MERVLTHKAKESDVVLPSNIDSSQKFELNKIGSGKHQSLFKLCFIGRMVENAPKFCT